MPKRDATTELNHDNWDQEDESEEAGEFKKASDDQMKVWKSGAGIDEVGGAKVVVMVVIRLVSEIHAEDPCIF